jgi:predicted amidohydrolase
MRSLGNLDALLNKPSFIDAVLGYGSDFALFPEFFTAPFNGRLQPFIRGRSY